MSSANIDIKIRTLIEGVQNLQALVTQLQNLGAQTSGINAGLGATASSTTSVGTTAAGATPPVRGLALQLEDLKSKGPELENSLKGALNSVDGLSGGFSKLVGYAKAAGAAYLAFLAIQGTKELADYAARTETLGVTLDIVASNAGYSKDAIAAYEQELKKLGITTQAARESMTAMVQAGIPLGVQSGQTASNVARLARASQDLAVVTGENSSQTLRRLTTNIQQMDTMGLRFMGLTVDIMRAQESFATSIGKSAGALSQQQKVIAVNNAVLEEAVKLQGAYEASMDTVGKKVASLKRYQEELSDAMGTKLLPAYGAIVDEATSLLVSLEKQVKGADASGEASARLGAEVKTLVQGLGELTLAFARAFTGETSGAISSIATNIVGLLGDLVGVAGGFAKASQDAGVFGVILQTAAIMVAGFRDGVRLLEAGLLFVGGAAIQTAGAILRGWGEIFNLFGNTPWGDALVKMGTQFEDLAASSYKASGKIIDDFKAGATATQALDKGIKNADLSLSSFGKATSVKAATEDVERLREAVARYGKDGEGVKASADRVAESLVSLWKKGILVGDGYDAAAQAAKEAGATFPKGFENAAKAAETMAGETKKAQKELEDFGKVKNIDGAIDSIKSLVRAQSTGTLSAIEQKQGYDKLSEAVARFKAEGADNGKVVKAQQALAGVSSNFAKEYEEALKNIGVTSEELKTGVNAKFLEMAGALATFVSKVNTSSEQFQQAFDMKLDTAKSTAEVNALVVALDAARDKASAFHAAGQFDEYDDMVIKITESTEKLGAKFDQVFETSLKAAKTKEDFQRIEDAVQRVGLESGKSIQWISSHLNQVGIAATEAGDLIRGATINEALQRIGMTAEEMRGQASKAIQTIVQDLKTLRTEAGVTGSDYNNAFTKAVDMSKTIADLKGFRAEAKAALEAGKTDWRSYKDELDSVDAKFVSLFAKQLNTATTTTAVAALVAQANRLKEEGSISAAAFAVALEQVATKAGRGAGEVARLAESSAKLAQKGAQIASAQKDSLVASLGVQKEKNNLLDAEEKYRQTGLDSDRSLVVLAERKVELSQVQADLSTSRLSQQQEEYKLQVAQQAVEDAKIANANDQTAASALNLQFAEREVAKQRESLALSQQRLGVMEAQKSAAEANVAQAEADADQAQRAAKETSKVIRSTQVDLATFALGKWRASADEQASYIKKFAEEYNNQLKVNDARRKSDTVHFDRLKQAENIALRTAKEYAQQEAIQNRLAAKEAEKQKLMEGQAEIFLKNKQVVADTARLAELGLTGLTRGADALSRAYYDAKIQAAEAAKSTLDSAKSFTSSTSSIHEELLAAEGKEAEVTALRFESRKAELAIQYQQLQLQIQIARVQAQAAGISTSELDKAAATSSAAYQQAVSDLGKLEQISLDGVKKKEEAEKKAVDDAKKSGDAQLLADTEVNKALRERQTLLEKERALRAGVLTSTLADSVSGASRGFSNPAAETAAAQEVSAPQLRAVDVQKFVLELGGNSATVYTKPNEGEDLLNMLNSMKKRASGS